MGRIYTELPIGKERCGSGSTVVTAQQSARHTTEHVSTPFTV